MKYRSKNWKPQTAPQPESLSTPALIGYFALIALAFICWIIITKNPEAATGATSTAWACLLN